MAAAAREEAARQEAVRMLELAAAKVQDAQALLQQPDWRKSVAIAHAAAEEAATEIVKATRSAKKVEREVAVTVKEQAELAIRVEKEAAAAAEAQRRAEARRSKEEADAVARQEKAAQKREKEEREANERAERKIAMEQERAEKEAAAAQRAELERQEKLVREEAEAKRREAEQLENEEAAKKQAEEDARKAHQDMLDRVAERGRLLADSKAKAERDEEEKRQKRAEELRAAAAEAERKAEEKKAKERKQLMDYEKKAKKKADEQAEKEALKAQKAAMKAEQAKAAEEAKSAAEESKASKVEEPKQAKSLLGASSLSASIKSGTPERARRSSAGNVASQRLERSSNRMSLLQDEASLTPRLDPEEDVEANHLSTSNAAVRGLAIDRRAAELLAQKLEQKRKKLQATQPPAWLKGWRKGGGKICEMEAEANFHGDALCVGDDGDTLFCVDGRRLGVFSAISGKRLWSMDGHTDQVICVTAAGDLVASAGRDKTIRLWSAASGQCTATLAGSDDAIYGLSMYGDSLFSGEKGGHARLWSISAGDCVATFMEHSGNIIWSTALNDAAAVSASHDTTARIWPVLGDVRGRTPSLGTLQHPEAVFCVSLVDDCVATACGDRIVRLWSLATLTCTHELEHCARPVGDHFKEALYPYCVHLLDRHVLVSGGGAEKSIKLWAIAGAGSADCLATVGHDATVRCVAASQQGFLASVGGKWKKLAVWRPSGWKPGAEEPL
jgi:hypothetical protein